MLDAFIAPFHVPSSPFGPGDDAAVVTSLPNGVVTTDAVVEGVHFTSETFSLGDIGHKALAVNLSDLAAMGAQPRWFLCALGLPRTFSPAKAGALGRGMAALADRFAIRLIGGNIVRSPGLTVTITAWGSVQRPLLRSGARVGDWVCVSGPLGDAAAGLSQLKSRSATGGALIRAQRRPQPALPWMQVAGGYLRAAIDVSDGLIPDLEHLCVASEVAVDVSSAAVPQSRALRAFAGPRSRNFALIGGEDYVVLGAVAPGRRLALRRALARVGKIPHFIGELKAHSRRAPRVTVDGARFEAQPFLHFR